MAGRTVGNIQVYVDADTSRLKVQMTRGGKVAGAAAAQAIEAELAHIEAELDKINVAKEAQVARRQLEAAFRGIKIDPDLDLKKTMAAIAAFEQQEIELDAFLNFDKANAQIFGFKQQTRADRAQLSVEVEIERTQMRADLAALQATMGELGLDVNMDFATADAELAAWRARQQANDLNLDVEVDTDGEIIGFDLSDAVADGFNKGITHHGKIIAGLVASLAETAAVGLQGLIGPAVELLGSAFGALGGGIGGLAPVLAGIGGTVAALGIGFLGMGDALGSITEEMSAAAAEGRAFNIQAEAINNAMRGLSGPARDFAVAFSEVLPQLQGMQRAISAGLFEGLGDELRSLSRDVIPDIGGALVAASQSANTFFKGLANAARDLDFTEMFLQLQPAVDAVGRGIANFVRVLGPFFKAASPAARELGKSFEAASESLLEMVRAGERSGKFQAFLLEGVDSLREWWRAIREVSSALSTLFQLGQSGGDSLVRTIGDLARKFNDWMQTAEGENAVLEFFRDARTALSAMGDALSGLGGLFDNLVTDGAIQRFAQLGDNLDTLLPVIGSLLEILGRSGLNPINLFVEVLARIAEALEPAIPALQDLADAVGGAVAGALNAATPLLEAAGVAIGVLAEVLTPLAPLLGAVAIGFGAFKIAQFVSGIGGAVSAIGGLTTGIGALARAHPVLLGISAAAGLAALAFGDFGDSQRDIDQRTREVSSSLSDQVQMLLDSGEAANDAAFGIEAFGEALAGADEKGTRLREALGTFGLQAKDSLDILVDVADDSVSALSAIGEEFGLNAELAYTMALAVSEGGGAIEGMDAQLAMLASTSGLSTAEFENMIGAMREIEAQAMSSDIDAMIRQTITQIAATSDLTATLLERAERETDLSRSGEGLTELYTRYTALLSENTEGTANLTAAEREQIEASRASVEALMAKEAEMQAAGRAADYLSTRLELMVGVAASMGLGVIDVTGLTRIAQEADKANTAATNLKSALDILTGGVQGLESSTIGVQRNFIDLTERLESAKAGTEGFSASLVDGSSAALDNREAFLSSAQGIQEWAVAALNSGMDADSAAAQYGVMRDQLIASAEGFDTGTMSATEYVDSILAAQGIDIETLISQPGMLQALIDTGALGGEAAAVPDIVQTVEQPGMPLAQEDLRKLDELGIGIPGVNMPVYAPGLPEAVSDTGTLQTNQAAIQESIETAFGMVNLDTALENTEALKTATEEIPPTSTTEFFVPNLIPARADVVEYDAAIRDIPVSDAVLFTQPGLTTGTINVTTYDEDIRAIPATDAILFTQPGLTTGISNVGNYESDILGLPPTDTTSFFQPGLTNGISNVNGLENAIDNVPSSKTVTFYIRTVGEIPRFATGGIAPMFGGIGGEAGLERAFYPDGTNSLLTSAQYVPAGTLVVPTEYLNSAQPGGTTIEKQVNADVKVYVQDGDGETIATKVINRMAASAAI